MATNSVKAGFRFSIMNSDNYSRYHTFPYHRCLLDEERYVNKYKIIQKCIIRNFVIKLFIINYIF